MRRTLPFALVLALSACALQEEVIVLEEPALDEERITALPTECDGDDDGIGGTGCEPVARNVPWR